MRKLGRGIRILITAILALLIAVNVYTIFQRLVLKNGMPTVFGYTTAVIISGSMEDTIMENDMVVVARQVSYREGEIVMYQDKRGTYVTHRIIGTTDEGFVTMGDNNPAEDPDIVPEKAIVGRVIYVIPKVGRVLDFFQTPYGIALLAVVGYGIIMVPIWIQQLKKKKAVPKESDRVK